MPPQFASGEIDFEGSKTVGRPLFRCARYGGVAASKDGADAREEFSWIEGLGEIVVSAEFKADHAIDDVRARGQEDDRDVVAGRTQIAQCADAILLRHHHVEHDDRWPLGVEPALETRAVVQYGDRETVALQVFANEIAHNGVVIDDEHMLSHAVYS